MRDQLFVIEPDRDDLVQLLRLAMQMAELPALEYGVSLEEESHAVLSALKNPHNVNCILRNGRDAVAAYVIGLPFQVAVEADPESLSSDDLFGMDPTTVIYVDDMNIHPDYRERFIALRMLIKGFRDQAVMRKAEVLLMHARRATGVSAFWQRMGGELIRSIDHWDGFSKDGVPGDEPADLLRLSLTDSVLPLNAEKWTRRV
jgi:hypothetical protein